MQQVFSIWSWIRWIHLVSAITWIGGQLFILVILLPIMRTALPRNERTLLFAQVGRRYAVVSWIALALLVVTGFFNGQRRGIDWSRLPDSTYGQILLAKLIIVAVVIVITLVHALVLRTTYHQHCRASQGSLAETIRSSPRNGDACKSRLASSQE